MPEAGGLLACSSTSELERVQRRRTAAAQDILEAHIKSRVRMGGKSISVLAIYILRPSVVIAHCIPDLQFQRQSLRQFPGVQPTYMHVQRLPIPTIPINNGRNNDELVFGHEIPYASFVLVGVVGLHSVNFEFEGRCEWESNEQ